MCSTGPRWLFDVFATATSGTGMVNLILKYVCLVSLAICIYLLCLNSFTKIGSRLAQGLRLLSIAYLCHHLTLMSWTHALLTLGLA